MTCKVYSKARTIWNIIVFVMPNQRTNNYKSSKMIVGVQASQLQYHTVDVFAQQNYFRAKFRYFQPSNQNKTFVRTLH